VAPSRARKGPAKKKGKSSPKQKARKAASATRTARKAGSRPAPRPSKPGARGKELAARKSPAPKAAKITKVPLKMPAKLPSVSALGKGAPPPRGPMKAGKGAPLMKGAAKAGKAGKGGTHGPDVAGHEQGPIDFEMEPPIRVVTHEPPTLPTPSRRKPKPGSPDWPGEGLTVGMEAPAFSLPSTLGRKVSLAEFRGTRVVLYFYPKDDTPGCTMEACAFRDNLARVTSKDAVILGVSLDDDLSHQRFAQKYNLQFPLLSDVDAAVSRQYGTYKEKNLYGRSFWGIERTTFVIDREGKVENVFRRVKVEGHADEVLATLSV
jgi:peroxiredoxin Q/BCP